MGEPIQKKMEKLRMSCEREVPIQEQRAQNASLAFRSSLQSIKLNAQQTAQNQVKLGELKAHVRELENDLVKVLAVKTRKEAKHVAISDSIASAKAKSEELKKSLHDRKARKDEYAAIMSQQLLDLATFEEKANQEIKDKEDIQEIISWYKRVLGLRIEGGRGGLKVIFNNVNLKDPNEEYSFTILLARDTYTLLNCDPHLDGTNELIQELNQTNGFFKFVRVMRKKFKASASSGSQSQLTSTYPVSSLVSASAPASPVSVDRNESLRKEITQVQDEEVIRTPEEVICGRQSRSPKSVGRSPGSASSVRRNYRSKATCRRISPGSASSNSSVYIICSPQLAHKGKERCNLKQRGFTIKSQMISSIH